MVNPSNTVIQEAFTAYFEHWLAKQEALLDRLLALSISIDGINKDQDCRELAAQVFTHYQEFFDKKNEAADEDVFLFYSAPWLSSFEHSLLWITGFRPSLVFTLVRNNSSSIGELSAEQKDILDKLKAETRRREGDVEKALAKVQESVAAPPIADLMRRESRLVDGENSKLETAMIEFKASMLLVMKNADFLRGSTVTKLFEVLNSVQIIKFLATATQFQLQTRRWGLLRDSRASSPTTNA